MRPWIDQHKKAPRRLRSPADGREARPMFRAVVDMRGLAAMAIAAGTGVWGLSAYPPATDNVFLQLIALREPVLFRALVQGYAALWFSTSFLAASLLLSLATIVAYRGAPARARASAAALPQAGDAAHAGPRARRDASPHQSGTRGGAHLADDSAARALHRRHDSRCGRHRQNVGVHVPVRRAAPPLARAGSRSEGGRARPRSQRGFLSPGARHARRAPAARTTTSKLGWTRASATTRSTTISIRTRSPTPWPRCSTICSARSRNRSGSRRTRTS